LLLGDKELDWSHVPVLDFDRAPAPKQPSKLRRLLGFGTITALISIGVAYAIPAARNFDSTVEFGQGIAAVAACDNSMTITPVSQFKNSSSPGDASYLMTSIKVSGIDLTPEGWDLGTDTWHPDFIANIDPELRSWAPGAEDNAGKYYNGTQWVPTCEGKVLLLQAFTNQSEYLEYTVGGVGASTSSPLWLNRPGTNAGFGVRVFYLPASVVPSNADSWVVDLFAKGEGVATNFDAFDVAGTWGETNQDWSNTDVNLYLDQDPTTLPPIDSRWVNRITIESTAKSPSDWAVLNDYLGQLL